MTANLMYSSTLDTVLSKLYRYGYKVGDIWFKGPLPGFISNV